MRATNTLLAGKVFTVAGYGWCGRGIAMRARGLGSRVIVTEVEPLRALEALMDGFEVLPMHAAARISDVIVTATGQRDVVGAEHFAVAKDGCLLANAGHFNVEVDGRALAALARGKSSPRPNVEEYVLADGRRLRLLAEGRLVNLVAAEGHPPAVMDMSFGNQALCVEFFAKRPSLAAVVHDVPLEIDRRVARLKLAAVGVPIDVLTSEQLAYAASWQSGT
jgi:adenosylhomocysteinase